MSSQELTPKDLEMIEEMAGHGFTFLEIAEVVATDSVDSVITALQTAESLPWRHYRKGFLKNQLALRQRIMKDALAGSSPAQTIMKGILDDAKYRNS